MGEKTVFKPTLGGAKKVITQPVKKNEELSDYEKIREKNMKDLRAKFLDELKKKAMALDDTKPTKPKKSAIRRKFMELEAEEIHRNRWRHWTTNSTRSLRYCTKKEEERMMMTKKNTLQKEEERMSITMDTIRMRTFGARTRLPKRIWRMWLISFPKRSIPKMERHVINVGRRPPI